MRQNVRSAIKNSQPNKVWASIWRESTAVIRDSNVKYARKYSGTTMISLDTRIERVNVRMQSPSSWCFEEEILWTIYIPY